jgi:hypothetical protein
MSFNKENPLESLNVETGLLEDVDAIREIGIRSTHLAQVLLQMPMAHLLFDQGQLVDLAIALSSSESMLSYMSQANYHRRLGQLVGADPRETEELIAAYKLSEVLPLTHPQAVKPEQEVLDPNHPLVKESRVLQQILAEQEDSKRQESVTQDEPVYLPPGIENFLKNFGREGDYQPEGE